ncbi:MAG: bifunctional tRNA (5-methylaminomethyl-2-thiouridine)(34)-methyltransferase MnmD/FAD-dependent 5-carboxymethylaminomethyl-2-thiouridine(34) oxidoreductase MnmC [Bdellovibrionales bacterium]
MKGAPRSKEFDDIYFSQEDGLAETDFVFLKGNNLPEAWADSPEFTIAETGFGTGLNFLATWKMFEEDALKTPRLNFVSFDKYPLSVNEIKDALEPWAEHFGGKIQKMLDVYPLRIPGVHSVCVAENVFLTLIFDDVNEALPKLSGRAVDAWFLDGFNPAKNPEMWTDNVFENMARLSRDGATFATFTAAGFVKRGLQNVGFDVQKTQGYGRKRERLVGSFSFEDKCKKIDTARSVAIIGGGLAGTSAAYWLKKQGVVPVIYEQGDQLGVGASGNQRGMVNPRISKLRNGESDFYMQAYAMAIREMKVLSETHDIEFEQCGAVHLMHNEDMRARFPSMVAHWGWHEDHARIVTTKQGHEISGVEVEQEGLYLPDAATVNPRKLCETYADGVEVFYNTQVSAIERQGDKWSIDGRLYDGVILANALGIKKIAQAWELADKVDLYPVRGQMSLAPETPVSQNIKTILNYRGYLSPALNGIHALGSTFDREDMDLMLREEDHAENVRYLEDAIPSLKGQIAPDGGRAALRVSSKHRFPLYGCVAPNMYVSTAHGSHGLVSTLQCAAIIHNHLCSCLRVYA